MARRELRRIRTTWAPSTPWLTSIRRFGGLLRSAYTLPFGTGKPFLNSSKWLDYIVGGWTYNAVAVYQTGFPLQIYQNNANSQYGYGAQRPNDVGWREPVS